MGTSSEAASRVVYATHMKRDLHQHVDVEACSAKANQGFDSLPAGRRNDGTVEPEPEHGAVVRGVPVARDGTVGCGHPVTPAVGGGEDGGSGVAAIHLTK